MVNTPNLDLQRPANGSFVNTWDQPTNSNWGLVDTALGAQASVVLNNLPVTLSSGQSGCLFITFTGVLTADVLVTFPSIGRMYILTNTCTGNFNVSCQTAALGATIIVPPTSAPIFTISDGTDMKFVQSSGQSNLARPGGRVTITSGTPVQNSGTFVTGATTIYYTPYVSQSVPLYTGSSFVMADVGGELSQLTTDVTKSPAAVVADSNYDLFVWNDSGTYRCTRGPAWTIGAGLTAARGVGAGTTELVQVQGIWLNANNIVNGPAAQRGTYVGTVRSNAAATIDWIAPAGALSTAGVLSVWNYYNRVLVSCFVQDGTASWTYNSQVVRQRNGSTVNQVSVLSGMREDYVTAHNAQRVTASAASGFQPIIGIGYNTYLSFFGTTGQGGNGVSHASWTSAFYSISQLGWQVWSANEAMSGAEAGTFVGSLTPPGRIVNGLQVSFMM